MWQVVRVCGSREGWLVSMSGSKWEGMEDS